MRRLPVFLFLLLFIVISFVLYGNTFKNGFVYDDGLFTTREELKQSKSLVTTFFEPYLPSHHESGVWRPLSTISVTIQYLLTGTSPFGFHLTNILLNGVITFLVFIILKNQFKSMHFALVTSVLFAFLPIHTEAVASIKSREDLFAAFFFLVSWYLFQRSVEGNSKKTFFLTLSSVAYLFSVFSKETFIISPLAFVSMYYLQHKPSFKKIMQVSIGYLSCFIVYMSGRWIVLGRYAFGNDDEPFVINPLRYVDLGTRIWTAFKIEFLYIKTIFFPIHLSVSYHFNQVPLVNNPFTSWNSIAGIISTIVFAIFGLLKRFRTTALGFGAIFFFVMYLVVSKFVVTGGEFMAERWMYIPSLGIVMMVGYVIHVLLKKTTYLDVIVVTTLCLSAALIIIPRNTIWASNQSFYESMVIDSPNSVHARYSLANDYYKKNDFSHAQEQVNIASTIYSEYAPLLTLQGDLFAQRGEYKNAQEYFLKATKIDQSYIPAYADLTLAYFTNENFPGVISVMDALLPKSHGMLTPAHYITYAFSLSKTRQYQKSIDILHTYIGQETSPDVRFLMAVNYYKLKQMVKAMEYFNWDQTMTNSKKLETLDEF